MIECEIKLKIENPKDIKEKLVNLSFVEYDSLTETDTYFDNTNGDIRSNDKALRIRESVNHTTGCTYSQINFKDKKLDNRSMSRPEYESEIADADTMAKILSCLGYTPVSPEVKKNRTILRSSSINACIDSVEGLGYFLELETFANNEAEKDEALLKLEEILKKIGYKMSDTTKTSYLTALQVK